MYTLINGAYGTLFETWSGMFHLNVFVPIITYANNIQFVTCISPPKCKTKTVKEKGEHELTTLRSLRRKLHRICLINVVTYTRFLIVSH